MASCAAMPAGAPGAMAGNSLECRSYHVGVAGNGSAGSPATHCPHAGPDGAGACGTSCEHYCDVVQYDCTGANAVYADRPACLAACATLDASGTPGDTSGDSVQCRTYHATAAVFLGLATHCPHAAVDSPVCNDTPVNAVSVEAASGYETAGTELRFHLVIPPGALSANTTLTIRRVSATPVTPANIDLTGPAWRITMTGGVTSSKPITLEFPLSPAPVHPALAEVVSFTGTAVKPLASFYRVATTTVVATTYATTLTVAPAVRTLQTETGAAVARGQAAFAGKTFQNEMFFGDVMGLHEVLATLPPSDAVAAGVQVDLSKVPMPIVALLTGMDLAAKDDALDNPGTTNALLRADAIVGVRAFYTNVNAAGDCEGPDGLSACPERAGITCALCHVSVTPTTFNLTAGMTPLPIGAPVYDGRPNLAMNAGLILSLTPYVQDAGLESVLAGWGAGRFDVRALPDNPLEDGVINPTDTPPLWNFTDLEAQSYTYDWDGLFQDTSAPVDSLASHAEAVMDLVMHANGAFGTASGSLAPQLSITPPQSLLDALTAAETGATGNNIPLADLQDIQAFERSMVSPAPGAFDATKAEAGWLLFNGKASCVSCHNTPEFTGADLFADIAATPATGGLAGGIHVAPLRGISATAPYFHDGSAPDLAAVVARYVARGGPVPSLTANEQAALVEYLKSL